MSNLRTTTGSFIDQIKINRIVREVRNGRTFWVKQRRPWSVPIIACANTFFRVVDNPVVVLSDLQEWQRWETESYLRLHGDEGYHAFSEGHDTVWAEQLPGRSLDQFADENQLTEPILRAAARELSRAHATPYAHFSGNWSHGDPHMGNFIFDETSGRARLIDFEVAHHPTLPEATRQADDVCIFLQDLMGRDSRDLWIGRTLTFLGEYQKRNDEAGKKAFIKSLLSRIKSPSGVGRIWWAIRTAYLAPQERNERIVLLKELLRMFL